MKTTVTTTSFYLAVLLVAVITGTISHFLLWGLRWAASLRDGHPWLLFLLPLLGLLTAFTYQRFGKGADKGNNLIIESLHKETLVPARMGLLTFSFTILSHLFGASVGREGSAVQIGGVISHQLGRRLPSQEQRRYLVHAGISAGFASIFGTPLAGAFFGMEMAYIGKLQRKALTPCFLAAFTANYTALCLGTSHEAHVITGVTNFDPKLLPVLILAAAGFGLMGRLFAQATHFFKRVYQKIANFQWRALLSATIVVVLLLLLNGQRYEGLSLWIMDEAFAGRSTFLQAFLKLGFTSLSLGAGFQGGEVTPLFDIGSAFGSSIAQAFSLSPSLLAALGMICVFGSAANAPITTIMLGIDLFGATFVPYYALAAFISYLFSGHQGIYTAQVVVEPKTPLGAHHQGLTLAEIPQQKGGLKNEA